MTEKVRMQHLTDKMAIKQHMPCLTDNYTRHGAPLLKDKMGVKQGSQHAHAFKWLPRLEAFLTYPRWITS